MRPKIRSTSVPLTTRAKCAIIGARELKPRPDVEFRLLNPSSRAPARAPEMKKPRCRGFRFKWWTVGDSRIRSANPHPSLASSVGRNAKNAPPARFLNDPDCLRHSGCARSGVLCGIQQSTGLLNIGSNPLRPESETGLARCQTRMFTVAEKRGFEPRIPLWGILT